MVRFTRLFAHCLVLSVVASLGIAHAATLVICFMGAWCGTVLAATDLRDGGGNSFSPSVATHGQPFKINFRIANDGTATSTPFAVRFYVSADRSIVPGVDKQIGSYAATSVPSFSTVGFEWSITSFPTNILKWDYYLGWIIDAANSIGETNESNNTVVLDSMLTVQDPPTIEVTPGSLTFPPTIIGQVSDLVVTVKNVGLGTLTGEVTGLATPFSAVGSTTYSLMPGETAVVTLRFAPSAKGALTCTATFTGGNAASCSLSGEGSLPQRTLAIESFPIAGVTISGDTPGTTNYSATCDDQQITDLSAPAVVTVIGSDYGFVRWVVDNANQPDLQRSLSVKMDADHTVVAQYFYCKLSIRSSPITGVNIGGDKSGTTNYSVQFDHQQTVNLSAQQGVVVSAKTFLFTQWIVDGAPQPLRQTTVQLTMDTNHTAEAVYNLLGDINGDCKINVLELVLVRNRLGQSTSTGDNWKADLDQDGRINVLDLILLRNRLGTGCP